MDRIFRHRGDGNQSEQRLQQAQKMEAVGQLAGGLAHDFNNLLGVILGYCELLGEQAELSEPCREMLQEIHNAGTSAKNLTQRLLTFSRRQTFEPVVLDLNRAVKRTEAMLSRLLGKDIVLENLLSARPGNIKADPSQVELVLMNLAINARDAMPKGGKITVRTQNVTIDTTAARQNPSATPGRYVMLIVSDTGIGMDAKTQSRIFEPYFSTKPVGKGTGLGLSSVFGIVKQSGGFITVSSELGRGSTFNIHFPWCDEAPTAMRQPEEKPERGGTETILLVDDSAPLRVLMRRLLERCGYTVLASGDPAEAVRMAKLYPGPISLLITDVVMPGFGGSVLGEKVTAVHPETRVLYASGHHGDSVAPLRVLGQTYAFLEKPFTKEDLLRKVRDILDSAPKLPPRK